MCETCKEGESLEDINHVLDMVGHGKQLAVKFTHMAITHGR